MLAYPGSPEYSSAWICRNPMRPSSRRIRRREFQATRREAREPGFLPGRTSCGRLRDESPPRRLHLRRTIPLSLQRCCAIFALHFTAVQLFHGMKRVLRHFQLCFLSVPGAVRNSTQYSPRSCTSESDQPRQGLLRCVPLLSFFFSPSGVAHPSSARNR